MFPRLRLKTTEEPLAKIKMALNPQQIKILKEQLLSQIENLPEDKKPEIVIKLELINLFLMRRSADPGFFVIFLIGGKSFLGSFIHIFSGGP